MQSMAEMIYKSNGTSKKWEIWRQSGPDGWKMATLSPCPHQRNTTGQSKQNAL